VDRGSVWEESIIFLPAHVRILGLSATIPNIEELAGWIGNIRQEAVKIIKNFNRVVPLRHFVFEKSLGMITLEKALKAKKHIVEERELDTGISFKRGSLPTTTHLDLIEVLRKEYLPCLYFVFSRKKCEEFAYELSRRQELLTKAERQEVDGFLEQKITETGVEANKAALLRVGKVLVRGIGYHHAGMLPIVKDVVEDLLARKLVKVLYCTETFAVGINMPVKTVCFDSNEKFDGKDFRIMSRQEYFQMAGRAGRRGIDPQGFVFTLADLNFLEQDKMVTPEEGNLEDLKSQFNLGYNSVLNLIANHQSEEEIESVLRDNFAYFQVSTQSFRIQERLAAVEKELSALLDKRCEDYYNSQCSLQHQKLWSKLKEDKRLLARLMKTKWGRSRRYQEKREQLSLKIKHNEENLGMIAVRSCTPEQLADCRDQRKSYNRLDEEKKQLYKLKAILQKETNFSRDYRSKRRLLTEMGFVEGDEMTSRGRFACKIYVQELLVTELYYDGVFHDFDGDQINALVACIGYEGRKNDWFKKDKVFPLDRVYHIIADINSKEHEILKTNTMMFQPEVALLAYQWSAGEEFANLRNVCNLQDGDIVSVMRRTIDLLRQIRSSAAEDRGIFAKLNDCIKRLDRDVVEVIL
jgi:superfamily II RNA helicase